MLSWCYLTFPVLRTSEAVAERKTGFEPRDPILGTDLGIRAVLASSGCLAKKERLPSGGLGVRWSC